MSDAASQEGIHGIVPAGEVVEGEEVEVSEEGGDEEVCDDADAADAADVDGHMGLGVILRWFALEMRRDPPELVIVPQAVTHLTDDEAEADVEA